MAARLFHELMIAIHGYAIVSVDDMIADASGVTPRALMNDADWAYFQAGLDAADIVVLGRLGHEANPNVRGRRRVVVSSSAGGLDAKDDAVWWNPARMPWAQAAERLLPSGGRVAVPGGQGVFDLFLEIGYAAFHLSRAPGVHVGAGRRLFSACDGGQAAEAVLGARGLVAGPEILLDPVAPVTLRIWERDQGAA